jgi:DNA repair and recombination protein RAD54B
LTTGTIEEKIFQRQILKQGLSGAVVDARENAKSHFTKEELKVNIFNLS